MSNPMKQTKDFIKTLYINNKLDSIRSRTEREDIMIDEQIKERRRIVNELERIKRAILNVRVDANILVADLEINKTECVEMANIMTNGYESVNDGLECLHLITRDRL